MHLIVCTLAWLARFPLLQQYLWLACRCARAIASDLVDPITGGWSHRSDDWFLGADRLVRNAHRLLDHVIASRACEIAGLPAPPRPQLHTLGRTIPTRMALWKRATEIVLRTRNVERHAHRLAAKLRANPLSRFSTAQAVSNAQPLSPAFPAKAGIQTRSRRLRTLSHMMESALRALAGPPPSRGMRLMDAAPRDGPAVAGALSAAR